VVDLFRNQKWDLVSKRGVYYLLSGLMLAAGIAAMFINKATVGKALNWGIDFTGGSLVTYRVAGKLPSMATDAVIGGVRAILEKDGLQGAEVQVSPGAGDTGDQVLVRIPLQPESVVIAQLTAETITPAVTQVVKDKASAAGSVTLESRDEVSGTIGRELISKGLFAIILGSCFIMLWIWFRYNIGGFGWRYSVAGIVALLHDLCTLVGMFALLHLWLQVNSPFIAALLTVLGYSIHDTIVIFDRIRENMRLRKGRTFAETVNISLLETLARSVNTILTVLLTLLALLFFGGSTLRDFVAAMLIGVIVGGYSSIFVASQLLVSWSKGKEREILPVGETLAGQLKDAAAAPALAGATSVVAMAQAPASVDAVQRARQAGKTAKRKR
jgi:preprotein translocase subunit SecF